MTIIPTFTDGDDRYTVSLVDTYQLNFLAGRDWLNIYAGTTTAWMGSGDDYVRLNAGTGTLYGQGGADRFDLYGGGWMIDGGADNDLFKIFGGEGYNLRGGLGDDRFYFYGDTANVHLVGGDGNDAFAGNGHHVWGAIYGGAGNDRYYGFQSSDGGKLVLRGGDGNDLYRLDLDASVLVDERENEGVDTIQIAGGISYTLGANVENLTVLPYSGPETLDNLTGNALNNRIQASDADDIIDGGEGNDVLIGGGGWDTIIGGVGNDRIVGGLGVDMMAGGEGADRYIFLSAAEAPYDPFLEATDWIYSFDSSDRIDVSAIDADTTMAGFQHFTVVEGEGSGTGTLHFSADPGGWGWIIVEGFTDGDSVPDFQILVTDAQSDLYPPVTASSFIV